MKRLIYFSLAILIASCSKNYDMNEFHKMYGSGTEDVGALLEKVSKHNIYFGHQSVGNNILSGIEQWENESGVQLNKVESRDFSDIIETTFVHFRVGSNTDPQSKIDDFVALSESIPGENKSIAFFKFCYVDFTGSSDVDAIFESYKEKMFYLKDRLPNCKVVLLTVPMTTIQKGIKGTAKKILGRLPSGVLENIKRNEFNERLLSEMTADFTVFDLAGVETTLPDGSFNNFKYKGIEYPCMPDFYSNDGGHLNDFGARIMAYNMIAFLAMELN